MTATRQARTEARARAAAEPFRQHKIEAMLRAAQEAGTEVLLRPRPGRLTGGAHGTPTVIRPGHHVELTHSSGMTSVPWSYIEEVVPWPMQ